MSHTAHYRNVPRGIFPMLYAFFDESGALDRRAFAQQVEAVIAADAQGVAVLGLITEVDALRFVERQIIVEWSVEEIAGRAPLLVTIAGSTLNEAITLARGAEAAGADAIVIQPPLGAKPDEADLANFFAGVMNSVKLPAGIQNAPEFLGVGLSPRAVQTLVARCPNFKIMKGEGPVVVVKPFVDLLKRDLAIFNGRGGLELPDNLRAGCAGMAPAPDCADIQIEIFDAWRQGDEARVDALYQSILPYVVFAMQSIPVAVAYGKRMFARRAGIENTGACRIVRDTPDPFFEAAMLRWSKAFGPYRIAKAQPAGGQET